MYLVVHVYKSTQYNQQVSMETSPASSLHDIIGEVGVAAVRDEQSHLTQVVVGAEEEREGEEDREREREKARVSLVVEEDPDEILRQVRARMRMP